MAAVSLSSKVLGRKIKEFGVIFVKYVFWDISAIFGHLMPAYDARTGGHDKNTTLSATLLAEA